MIKEKQSTGVATDSITVYDMQMNNGKATGADVTTKYYDHNTGDQTGEAHSTHDTDGKCVSNCQEPAASKQDAKKAQDDAEAKAKKDADAKAKADADAKKAADAKAKPAAGASSCASPDSCSSSCTGANEQATFSGNCMSSQEAAAHAQFSGNRVNQDPLVNPGAGNDDRAAGENQACSSGQSGEANVCAQINCGGGDQSNELAAQESDGGSSGSGNGPSSEVVTGGLSGARVTSALNSIACCGMNRVQLQQAFRSQAACAVMQCAQDTGACSCGGLNANGDGVPHRDGPSLGGGNPEPDGPN